MAQTTTQKSRPRGRPSSDGVPRDQKALKSLQKITDRITGLVADSKNSMAAMAARCARAGVPAATVDMAVDAVLEALEDTRTGIARAYSAPAEKPKRTSRVNLLAA